MIHLRCILFITLFPISNLSPLFAQTLKGPICFAETIADGDSLFQIGQYGRANNTYWSANTCEYEPGYTIIKEKIDKVILALEGDREKALNLRDIAEQHKLEAQQAQEKAEMERAEKEVARQEAVDNGVRSESVLISILAENARQGNEATDALWFSFMARLLLVEQAERQNLLAFGLAVRDSFSQILSIPISSCEKMDVLAEERVNVMSGDRSIWIDLQKGEILEEVNMVENNGEIVETAANGTLVAHFTEGNAVQVYSADGDQVHSFIAHQDEGLSLAFSRNYRYLASGSRDHQAVIYDLSIDSIIALKGHNGNIYGLIFNDENNHVLTRSSDGSVRAWTVHGEPLGAIGSKDLYIRDALFTSEPERVITGSVTGAIKQWTVEGSEEQMIDSLDEPIKELAYLKRSKELVTRTLDEIRTIPLSNEQESRIFHEGPNIDFTINHDQTAILTWSSDGSLKLTTLHDFEEVFFQGSFSSILSADFSVDNQHFVTTDQYGNVILWDMHGNQHCAWETNNRVPIPAKFTRDGKSVIIVKDNNQILRTPIPNNIFAALKSDWANVRPILESYVMRENLKFIKTEELPLK